MVVAMKASSEGQELRKRIIASSHNALIEHFYSCVESVVFSSGIAVLFSSLITLVHLFNLPKALNLIERYPKWKYAVGALLNAGERPSHKSFLQDQVYSGCISALIGLTLTLTVPLGATILLVAMVDKHEGFFSFANTLVSKNAFHLINAICVFITFSFSVTPRCSSSSAISSLFMRTRRKVSSSFVLFSALSVCSSTPFSSWLPLHRGLCPLL